MITFEANVTSLSAWPFIRRSSKKRRLAFGAALSSLTDSRQLRVNESCSWDPPKTFIKRGDGREPGSCLSRRHSELAVLCVRTPASIGPRRAIACVTREAESRQVLADDTPQRGQCFTRGRSRICESTSGSCSRGNLLNRPRLVSVTVWA